MNALDAASAILSAPKAGKQVRLGDQTRQAAIGPDDHCLMMNAIRKYRRKCCGSAIRCGDASAGLHNFGNVASLFACQNAARCKANDPLVSIQNR
jgi:hypothetical protein